MAAVGLLVAVLVGCGCGGFWYARPYLSDQYPATLRTPDDVAGLTRSAEAGLEEAAVQMAATLSGRLGLAGPIAAVYVDPDTPERTVAVWGGTALLRDPAARLDDAFRDAAAGGFPVADPQPVDPGPPGGVARCAVGESEGLGMTVCGWADHGSLVMLVFLSPDLTESAALLRDFRAALRSG